MPFSIHRDDTDGISRDRLELMMLLANKSRAIAGGSDLRSGSRKDFLSLSQRRLWVLEEMQDLGAAYNLPCAVLVEGTLDFETLSRCVRLLFDRHEALRTIFFDEQGMPGQRIVDVPEVALELEEVSGSTLDERLSAARLRLNQWCSQPFDLRSEIPFRVGLFRLDETSHILTMVMHHIVSDAWSINVLLRDLWTSYAAFAAREEPALPPLTMCYSDFAEWQRSSATEDAIEKQVQYWKEALGDAPTGLELPTDQVRPAVQSYRGAVHRFTFPAELIARVNRLAREENVTTFMYFLTVFSIVLSRWSGQEDVVIGSPTAGRVRREFEDLVGFFVNMLPLRLRPSSNQSFRELLANTRKIALEAYANQDVPFDVLVDAMQPARDFSRHPVFQATFALQSIADDIVALPNLTLQPFDLHTGAAKFDIAFTMTTTSADASGEIEYAADLFSPNAIELLAGHLLTLTERLTERHDDPIHQISMLGEQEKKTLERFGRNSKILDHAVCIHNIFEQRAKETPDASAVIFGSTSLTYSEVNERADQLAKELLKKGARDEAIVGICIERSCELVIAILGVLKAGCAYLPLDPMYPTERLQFMLSDSGTKFLLVSNSTLKHISQSQCEMLNVNGPFSDDSKHSRMAEGAKPRACSLAYMIYTSGSTGTPKGVLVEHRGVENLSWAHLQHFSINKDARVLQFASVSFDAAIWEMLMCWRAGATLILIEEAENMAGEGLGSLLRKERITHTLLSPSVFRTLPKVPYPDLKTIILGGEPITSEDLRGWKDHHQIMNAYGPTEASVCVTMGQCNGGSVALGRPNYNVDIKIVDKALTLVPIGFVGEICVSGVALSRGYHNRTELTDQKFASGPDATRMYRTGDLGRWREDGTLQFLGRVDDQVKVRGFRIELGEVSTKILAHPEIADVVVIASRGRAGEGTLVAYYVGRVVAPDLREHLRKVLPDYMIPSAFISMDTIPLLPNGKVDRKSLPPAGNQEKMDRCAPCQGVWEEIISAIWAETLSVSRVGRHDNFFDLGGHSFAAIQVLSWLRAIITGDVTPASIFACPTVEEMARLLDANHTRPDVSETTLEMRLLTGEAEGWFSFLLQGPLDISLLSSTCSALISRWCSSVPRGSEWVSEETEKVSTASNGPPVVIDDRRGIFQSIEDACNSIDEELRARGGAGDVRSVRIFRCDADAHVISFRTCLPSNTADRIVYAGELRGLYLAMALKTGGNHDRSSEVPSRQQTCVFPEETWSLPIPESQGMSSEELAKLVRAGIGMDLDSLTVARYGHMLVDAYYGPFQNTMLHALNSATKAVTGTLIGCAIREGLLKDLDQPACEFLPEWRNAPEKRRITIGHLLNMTSGLEWDEPLAGGVPKSYYEMSKSTDWLSFILSRPLSHTPGTHFNYNSGNAHLLSAILCRAADLETEAFAQSRLFAPLGITDFEWGKDPSGLSRGGEGLWLRPADMARIGQLYLACGQWRGEQLLPSWWVSGLTNAGSDVYRGRSYANLFWSLPSERIFLANGHNRQLIMLFPDEGIVVVTTARRHFAFEEIYKGIRKALTGQNAANRMNTEVGNLRHAIAYVRAGQGTAIPSKQIQQLSGKRYKFSSNELNLSSMSFEAVGEALSCTFWLGQDTKTEAEEIRIGTRGYFIPERNDQTQMARGTWSEPSTFVLERRSNGRGEQERYTFTFRSRDISVLFEREKRALRLFGREDL
ncbi:amino acid adenylation domain-containing protein [Agrobacterium vitis]|uniref:Amino acid adenylation domain-containing protein n=1 Tax=Agrobacterium vitis TaxID=373 RepID=A0A6L6VHC1_AGRVI|nr:non-ribosomal peptide synthetase [Agrobacterium vitis]MUZ75260.1 amino acid adenylation domain-containing protein [Agrobacterium vitis]